MQVREIQYNSPAYRRELELRNRVLRIPLGLDIHNDNLQSEGQQQHFGLFDGDQLVGCVVVLRRGETHAKVRQMAIDPKYQRQGWGRKLLGTVEQRLARSGVLTLELSARAQATDFYHKLGYHQVGSAFVEVGIPHLGMHKQLAST